MTAVLECKKEIRPDFDFEITTGPISDSKKGVFRRYHVGNDPANYIDPDGLTAIALPALCIAQPELCGVIGGIVIGEIIWNSCYEKRKKEKEHTKNARPSTKGKHEQGKARKKRDKRGGEKGDDRRAWGRDERYW
jgi:hypothetical protein